MRGVEAEKHHITQLDTEAAASATSCNTTLGMAGMPHAHNTKNTTQNSRSALPHGAMHSARGELECCYRSCSVSKGISLEISIEVIFSHAEKL